MSDENMDDIVKNFVDHDLASLDRVGRGSESFALSPHLTEPSPDLSLATDHANSLSDLNKSTGFVGTTESNLKVAPGAKDSSETPHSAAHNGESSITAAGSSAITSSPAPSLPYFTPDLNKDNNEMPEAGVSRPLPKVRSQTTDPLVEAVESQRSHDTKYSSRQTSSASTSSKTIPNQKNENRSSLGNKLKAFGKRITSGSSR